MLIKLKKMKFMKGSYTIEAALIFPMVLFVLLFIIYSAFYMHNQTVIYGAAYEVAIYGTTLERSDISKMKAKMQEKYQESVGDRLISMESPEVTMEVNGDDVTVKISGKMRTVKLGFLPDYNHAVIRTERTVSYSNPVDKIRILTMIDEIQ